jgi:gliding motility-associated protein GldM
MANANLPPRQRMINMMYLVLTAILALNVSGEILQAFKVMNDGILRSNSSLGSKNASLYSDIDFQYTQDPIKAKLAHEKSLQAKALTNELFALLEQHKQQMIIEAGGLDPETGRIVREEDMDISTRTFAEGKAGKELKSKIEDTRNKLLTLLDENERKQLSASLPLQVDNPTDGKAWEYARFNQVPVAAAVALMSKYQNDLLASESMIVERLSTGIDKKMYKVDKLAAMVLQPSNYILQGENYSANILVAGYSSTQQPEMYLGQFTSAVQRDENGQFMEIYSDNDNLPLLNPVKVDVQGGFGKMNVPATAIGDRKYTGVVKVKAPQGGYMFYPFESEYKVAKKTGVISPTKMNVMYIGLDNPLDISVPGVAQADVTAQVEGNGSVTKNADGTFTGRVNAVGPVKVKVFAKVNGKQMLMAEQTFRAKRVPDPITTIDGIKRTSITRSQLANSRGVVALTEGLEWDGALFKVAKFRVTVIKADGTAVQKDMVGPLFTTDIKDVFKNMKKGETCIVEDVVANAPEGRRNINPLVFKISQF